MSSKHGVAMPSVDVWWCENLLCIRWKRRFYFSAPWYLRQIIQENAFSNNTKQQSAICFSAFSLENFLLFLLFIPRKVNENNSTWNSYNEILKCMKIVGIMSLEWKQYMIWWLRLCLYMHELGQNKKCSKSISRRNISTFSISRETENLCRSINVLYSIQDSVEIFSVNLYIYLYLSFFGFIQIRGNNSNKNTIQDHWSVDLYIYQMQPQVTHFVFPRNTEFFIFHIPISITKHPFTWYLHKFYFRSSNNALSFFQCNFTNFYLSIESLLGCGGYVYALYSFFDIYASVIQSVINLFFLCDCDFRLQRVRVWW